MNMSFAIFGTYIANSYYLSEIYIWLDVLYFLWKLNQGKKLGLSISKNEGGSLVLITKHWLFQAHTLRWTPSTQPQPPSSQHCLCTLALCLRCHLDGGTASVSPSHGSDTGVCVARGGCHFTALTQGPRLSPSRLPIPSLSRLTEEAWTNAT